MATMKHALSLATLLAALWWVLSGQTGPLLLGLGLASTLAVTALALRMDLLDRESHPVHLSGGLVRYWWRLAGEIVRSNLEVVGQIVAMQPRIEPRFIRTRTRQPTDLGRVILANSITLTPGTVTVELAGEDLLVHALTRASAEAVLAGELDALVPLDSEARH
jgi:multicomponent Na+:H+ antiporter subunit E